MPRFRLLFGAVVASGAIASADAHAPPADLSWGKPGVSLAQYASDAAQCADTSRAVVASITPATLTALDALSAAQLVEVAQYLGHGPDAEPLRVVADIAATRSAEDIARRSLNFGARYTQIVSHDVRGELQAALDTCLADRGYARIRLTESQLHALSRLKRHTPERTAYLHAIDSDPVVVAQQAMTAPPSPR